MIVAILFRKLKKADSFSRRLFRRNLFTGYLLQIQTVFLLIKKDIDKLDVCNIYETKRYK